MITNNNVLTRDSILWFGKYKDKAIEYVLLHDSNYLHWIVKDKIQGISFSDDIILPPFKRRMYIGHSSGDSDIFGLDKYYREQKRNEYPSVEWGHDGDYYPNGCDIWGFG